MSTIDGTQIYGPNSISPVQRQLNAASGKTTTSTTTSTSSSGTTDTVHLSAVQQQLKLTDIANGVAVADALKAAVQKYDAAASRVAQ